MAATAQDAEPHFAEIERGILQASSNIELHLLASYFPPGTLNLELRRAALSRQALDTVARQLRAAGFAVDTIDDEIAKLPSYNHSVPPATPFHLYQKAPVYQPQGQVAWKLFSLIDRNFYPCPAFKKQGTEYLFAREQSVIGAFDEHHGLRGLWVASTKECGLQSVHRNETLIHAHMQSRPAIFYYVREGNFAAIFRNYIWLPGPHYHLLFEKLAIQRPKKGEDRWFIRLDDLDTVQRIVASLGLSLQEGEPPQFIKAKALDVAESASQLISLCYTHYLRSKEEKFREFVELAINRDWEAISDKKLRAKIIELSNAAYSGKKPEDGLMEYIGNLLPTDIHWSEKRDSTISTEIQGVAIDVDASGYHAKRPFFKVVLPEFELMLGVLTSQLSGPTGHFSLPIYWVADKWRILPYAGRLVFPQGRHTTVLREIKARHEASEQAFNRIYGIPSLEDNLVKGLYLSAFFIDRDERLWKGCPEFSRYFTGYGRIIEKETGEFEKPTALMEDIFGNRFYLAYGEANYIHRGEAIGWMGIDCPKRFFARSCLIQQLRMSLSVPYFTLLENTSPRDVGWDEVLSGTYLALLRYYRTRTDEQLLSAVEHIKQPTERKKRIIEQILKNGRALRYQGKLFYVYQFMSPDDLRAVINNKQVPVSVSFFYKSLSKFESIIHPFEAGKSILAESDPWENVARKYFREAVRHPIIINSNDVQYWTVQVAQALKLQGIVAISVHPWKRWIASEVICKVRSTLSECTIQVDREDVPRTFRGQEVIETHYRLTVSRYLMLRELRRNPTFKILN